METVKRLLSTGDVWAAMPRLRDTLRERKRGSTDGEWDAFLEELAEDQALADLLCRCPYTRRAKEKPRGYAGDAVMMDFVYGLHDRDVLSETDGLGQEIFRFTTNSAAARAVRDRRRLIARLRDEACTRRRRAHILSVACGHLREAELSQAVRKSRFERFVALDQDQHSLRVVEAQYRDYGVETFLAGVRAILTGSVEVRGFDLIYSAGLYDYLPDEIASRLTAVLASGLRAGGKLLVANFVPGHEDVGYMEAIMDWKLVCRTAGQLEAFFPANVCVIESSWRDPTQSLAYVLGAKAPKGGP